MTIKFATTRIKEFKALAIDIDGKRLLIIDAKGIPLKDLEYIKRRVEEFEGKCHLDVDTKLLVCYKEF